MGHTMMNAEQVTERLEDMIYQRDKLRAMVEVHAERGLITADSTFTELQSWEDRVIAYAEYWSLDYDA